MKFLLESVSERDIDLLVASKFMTDMNFVSSFCKMINDPSTVFVKAVEEVVHSQTDNDGESDLFVLLDCDEKKIGLFIENKIDAIAMPDQHGRYIKRAKKGLGKKYDEYRIVLISPKEYSNEEAEKYENRISYEDMKKMVNDEYSVALLDEAIRERKKGYEVIEDTRVTEFRQRYYEFVNSNYRHLNVREVKGPAGTNAVWVTFDSLRKGTMIQHKSNKGYVDLEISGYGNKAAELFRANKDLVLQNNMVIAKANKSAAIRAAVPIIDFHKSFDEYKNEMHEVCKTVDFLQSLVTKINYNI